MSGDGLEERLRKVEVRFAYLTGSAVVGLAAILAFWGLTSWQTIPSAVEGEVRTQIGEETLLKINEAGKKAQSILSVSALQNDVRSLREARVCDKPVEECVCNVDGGGATAKLVVCITRCPDGRLRGVNIKEIVSTTDPLSCEKLLPAASWQ